MGHGDVDGHSRLHGPRRGGLQSRGGKRGAAAAQGLIEQRSGNGAYLALAALPSYSGTTALSSVLWQDLSAASRLRRPRGDGSVVGANEPWDTIELRS